MQRLQPRTKFVALILIFAIATSVFLFGVQIFQKDSLPDKYSTLNVKARVDTGNVKPATGVDPCGGTGGTGQIVEVGNNSIRITRKNSETLLINFTSQTTFTGSAGSISRADLKVGDRVTVVVDFSADKVATARAVFVCTG